MRKSLSIVPFRWSQRYSPQGTPAPQSHASMQLPSPCGCCGVWSWSWYLRTLHRGGEKFVSHVGTW